MDLSGEMQVSWQHPILEIKNFITFGKAVNGSSSFARLIYSSLMPNNKQSGDL